LKKTYRTLVVDDERLARNDIVSLLKEYPDIVIVGEASDTPSALKAIEQLDPELIFLDIQMPGQSGFDLLNAADTGAKVIFVTAFDEYALRAFEVNALDYLMKPVNPKRLRSALEKLELNESPEFIHTRKLKYDDNLFLQVNTTMKFIRVNTLVCINASGDYSEIITDDGHRGLTLKSMKEWESRLPENYFCRIHRSTIVNLELITKVEKWFNNSYRLHLKGIEAPMVMSRRYAVKLKEKMG
jgi:two-component system, LytTR family, response regulator